MKKILSAFFITIAMILSVFCNIVKAEDTANTIVLEGKASFDWLDMSQIERDTIIQNYKKIIFGEDTVYKYTKKDFKEMYKDYLKDTDRYNHYLEAQRGVTETDNYKISAFYNGHTLYIYAIQYKKNPKITYYYDALGNLRYVDVISDNYPNFPYWSKQYNIKGKMVSAVYFTTHDMQYMYEQDGEFQGVWFKDKMYDRHAKQTLTRTNW